MDYYEGEEMISQLWRRLEDLFPGHVSLGPVVVYGFNAMHVAVNVRTDKWGWLCFHPTIKCFGKWWPWYFYVSRSATPWEATFAIGPGVSDRDKARAGVRRFWPKCKACKAHVEDPGAETCWRHRE